VSTGTARDAIGPASALRLGWDSSNASRSGSRKFREGSPAGLSSPAGSADQRGDGHHRSVSPVQPA
jgi:hypothetical protein